MRINYYTAPCGAGKTYQSSKRIVNQEGRYIIVRDRVQAILEYQTQLNAMALASGRTMLTAAITNERGKSVRLQVENLVNEYDSTPHVAVMITHKAMMMCDFSLFRDWHIIIDETPVVLDQQELKTGQSLPFFERNYELEAINEKWASVSLTRDGWNTTAADLERDDCFRLLRVFHERVTHASELPDDCNVSMVRRAHTGPAGRRAVISNLKTWGEMQDGREWTWWSLWSPRQLEAFETITIMANAFDQSMTYKILKNLHPDIEWIPIPLAQERIFDRRKVVIEFFAQNHTASRFMFGSDEGQHNLKRIAHHLQDRYQIWMANERHADHLDGMGGKQLTPQQAGSNEFAGYHSATCIYSAKPSEEVRSILEILNVESSAWVHSNEYEVILQFMCRTSIRDPQSRETVTMTVYDDAQAEYLRTYFAAQPYCDVEVVHVDLEMVDRERKKGRPVLKLTPEEADAKAAHNRAVRAASQAARRKKAKIQQENENVCER